MAKLKFKNENNEFIPVVQDVKVNNSSVFNGENANIKLKTINNQSIVGTGNITIQSGDGEYVKYTANQNLTDQQKLNARNNIDAVSTDELRIELNEKQNAKPDGRNNLITNDTKKLNVKYLPATALGGLTNGGTFNRQGTITASIYAPELDGLDIRNVVLGSYPPYYFIYIGENNEAFFGYSFSNGDWAINLSNGWIKLDTKNAVTSVNGHQGDVILTADDFGAVYSYWGVDNANKNLVTDEFGQVTVSNFPLGQILVDVYSELPNVNPEAPHQNIPVNARATVARTIDVYPKFTIQEFQNAYNNSEQLEHTVVFFDPEERPTKGAFASLSNNTYVFYVACDTNSTSDCAYRIEVENQITGDRFEMIYSWTEQPYKFDENVMLSANTWNKVYIDPNTGDYVSETTDHNDIPQLDNAYVTAIDMLDDAFMVPITWDNTLFSGDYIYTEQTSATNSPTYYWKYAPLQEQLVSGKTIKTINNESILGNGNITVPVSYTYNFQTQNWETSAGMYILQIPTSEHNLGFHSYVANVENSSHQNVTFSYAREVNGTLIIYSNSAFDGRAILQQGE